MSSQSRSKNILRIWALCPHLRTRNNKVCFKTLREGFRQEASCQTDRLIKPATLLQKGISRLPQPSLPETRCWHLSKTSRTINLALKGLGSKTLLHQLELTLTPRSARRTLHHVMSRSLIMTKTCLMTTASVTWGTLQTTAKSCRQSLAYQLEPSRSQRSRSSILAKRNISLLLPPSRIRDQEEESPTDRIASHHLR